MTTRPRVRSTILILLAVLAGGGYAVLRHYSGSSSHAQTNKTSATAPIPVQIATVEKSDFPVYLTGLGTVQGFNTVVVRTLSLIHI